MLSIKALTHGAGDIFAYLSQGDYYSERDRVAGQWFGKGATALGLTGEVKLRDFENIRESNDPRTGEFLRVRHSRNNMYDLTFSAPKSVSIMARPGGDRRLDDANKIAVGEVLTAIENGASCEVQKGGKRFDRKTGCLVAAVYTHDSSRELDPQLHSHCAVGNMTYDAKEQRWKALDISAVFERKAYFQEIYRNSLAREVMKLGYQVENRWNDRHTDQSFEIVGISRDLCKKFSRMSEKRDEAIGEFIERHGERPTNREVGELVRAVRPEKMYEISGEEVAARQRARLSEAEKAQLAGVREKAMANDGCEPERWAAEVSVQHAMAHTFERVSVARDYDLARQALIHGRGRLEVAEIERCFQSLQERGAILRHKKEIATEQTLNREKQMIGLIDWGKGKYDRLDRGTPFVPSGKLNDKQKEAVDFVLGSRDFAVNLQGAPGTGKTWTLQDIHRGLKGAGRDVLAIAPTRSAKNELEKVGIEKPLTVEALTQDKSAGERMRDRVVLIDEAAMLSSHQMSELLRRGYAANARFIFSGDTRQIPSVAAGDALRILETESSLKSYELKKIERQKENPEYLAAIEAMREDPQRGFDLLDAMGAIQEVAYFDRPARVAKEVKERNGALIVASTHDEIDRINRAVKREDQEPKESRKLVRMEALNWTEAQKRDTRNFEPGQYLLFHRSTKEGKLDSAYCVTGSDGRFIHTVDLQGERVSFSKKQAASFGVFEKREVEVSVGDKLIFLANGKRDGFECVNGNLAVITAFDKKGRAVLDDGRTLPKDFFQFNLGYAISSHKSQGKTVDDVVISADAMNRELFYVSASRGRHSIAVFTSNKEMLREYVAISGARTSALEVERQCSRSLARGRNGGNGAAAEETEPTSAERQEPDDRREMQEHRSPSSNWPPLERTVELERGRGGM